MEFRRPPLLARLRRRLAATAWLFALLLVAKATLAGSCLNDESLAAESTTATAIDALKATAAAPSDLDSAAPCSHTGTGGHCACVHVTALPAACQISMATPGAADPFPAFSTSPKPARRESTLRPPIA